MGARNFYCMNRLISIKLVLLLLITVNFACYRKVEKEIVSDLHKSTDNQILSLYDSNTLVTTADSLFQNNSFVGSINLYSELVKRDSLNGEFFYRRGYSYGQLLMFDSAVLDFERSAQLGFRKFDAYYSLGIIYSHFDDSMALYHLNNALNEDPSSQLVQDLIFNIKNQGSLSI